MADLLSQIPVLQSDQSCLGYPGKTWEAEWLACVLALDGSKLCGKAASLADIPAPAQTHAEKDGVVMNPGWRNAAGNFIETSMRNEGEPPQFQTYGQQIVQNVVTLRTHAEAIISGSYRKVDPKRYAAFPRNGKELWGIPREPVIENRSLKT